MTPSSSCECFCEVILDLGSMVVEKDRTKMLHSGTAQNFRAVIYNRNKNSGPLSVIISKIKLNCKTKQNWQGQLLRLKNANHISSFFFSAEILI